MLKKYFANIKNYSHFFSKNISLYAIFNDQNFKDTLTNDIVSFEQLGPDFSELKNLSILVRPGQQHMTLKRSLRPSYVVCFKLEPFIHLLKVQSTLVISNSLILNNRLC